MKAALTSRAFREWTFSLPDGRTLTINDDNAARWIESQYEEGYRAGIERAARLADDDWWSDPRGGSCAAAIRALLNETDNPPPA